MALGSFEAVFFTAAFLVPGFVWSAVVSMLVPRRVRATELRVLEFLTLSCLNYGLWSWALFLIFRFDFLNRHPVWAAISLTGIIFISPVVLGLVSGRSLQRDWVARFLGRLGSRTVHLAPTAWDYQFSRGKPYWAMVRLSDGSTVYGFYGLGSFASDEPEQRDLYLEATYRLTDSGEWAPVEDTGGVLITGDQIAWIEFRKLTEVDYGKA